MLRRDHIFLSLLLSISFIQSGQPPRSGSVSVAQNQPQNIPDNALHNGVRYFDENELQSISGNAGGNVSSGGANVNKGDAIVFTADALDVIFGETPKEKRMAQTEADLRKAEREAMSPDTRIVSHNRRSGSFPVDSPEMKIYVEQETARQAAAKAQSLLVQAERAQMAELAKQAVIAATSNKHPAIKAITPVPSWAVSDEDIIKSLAKMGNTPQVAPSSTEVIQGSSVAMASGWYAYGTGAIASGTASAKAAAVSAGTAVAALGTAICASPVILTGIFVGAIAVTVAAERSHKKAEKARAIREAFTHPTRVPEPIHSQPAPAVISKPKREKISHHRHPNPSPDPRTTGVEFKFPENPGQRDHGWRLEGGHIVEGTPRAREIILDTIKNGKYHGQDAAGNHQFSMIQPDGNQTFAKVRDSGMIQNQGGCPAGEHWIVGKQGFLVAPEGWNKKLVKPLQYGIAALLSSVTGMAHGGLENYEAIDTNSSPSENHPHPKPIDLELPKAPIDSIEYEILPDMPLSIVLPAAPRAHTVKRIKKERKDQLEFAAKKHAEINKILNGKKY